jgi:DNA repair exonuclease SbcCD ATPase subunit
MAKADTLDTPVTVHVENIGGISETELDIPPGITVLSGRNATNRTSFLQAIMGAMGSDEVSLKADADEGFVEVALGTDTYRRVLEGQNGAVATKGNPYLDDSTLADLFAFLLESNEARRAVAQQVDLRDLIMRPVDTAEIQREIERLERKRDKIDEELDELDALKDEIPSLTERKTRLESEIEEKRDQLAAKEEEIESMDADVEKTREDKQELDTKLEELRDLRSELEQTRSEIDLQEESIESLRNEKSTLSTEREDLPETPMGEYENLEQDINDLRNQKQTLESKMSNLQDIIQFNEEMLDGEADAVANELADSDTDGSVTDQLVDDASVVCWTCGSEVNSDRISEAVEQLRSVRREYLSEVQEIEDELDKLRSQQQQRKQQQQRRRKLDRKLEEIEDELERRQSTVTDLREKRERFNNKIETAEQEVEELESENFSEILDLHKEANQMEFDLGQLESELDDVTDRLTELEDRVAEEDDLQARRGQIQEELETQRTRIERIEREAVNEFNNHMDQVLDMLEYENLARVWIERVQTTAREGRQKVEKTAFELHVVRTTSSGATYEDTIDHLSESELEVTGLIFALAGYLVHDLHETVPFMLMDSLEAIDSERLADLILYFGDYADYLVVALLPEDAQALSDTPATMTEI